MIHIVGRKQGGGTLVLEENWTQRNPDAANEVASPDYLDHATAGER